MLNDLIAEIDLTCEEINDEMVTNPEGDVRVSLSETRDRLRNAARILEGTSDHPWFGAGEENSGV